MGLATTHAQQWEESFYNAPQNLRYGSANPTRIADNVVRDFAAAEVHYGFATGKLHAVDQADKMHDLAATIGGLRHIGHFDVAGHLTYTNRTERSQIWNTSLWTNPNNPFFVCDSVPGDVTTEDFDLQATGAYTFNSQWRMGLQLGLRTGNRADQTDPRPETTTAVIPVQLGVDFNPSETWTFGLSGGFRHFSSALEYYSVQPLKNHTYFVMKGMGDYMQRSTGSDSGYKRDYTGATYSAALQAAWHPADGPFSDFLEVSYATENQDARDGSTAYEFRGGDFSETRLSLQNRFQFRQREQVLHNVTLAATVTDGQGKWSEQKRETDAEHGNITYYRVLATNTNHKSQRLSASLLYQLDFLHDGQRDLFFSLGADFTQLTRKQLLGSSTPKQEISLLALELQAGKCFAFHDVNFLAQLQGGYTHPLSKKFATGSPYTDSKDITDVYVRPLYEYETSRQGHTGLLLDASLPVSSRLAVGVYATADCRFYLDKEEYWTGFKGKARTTAQFGAYLKF